jgi:ubiquinone/menaquinone biosynthesis C-methylase UbiE
MLKAASPDSEVIGVDGDPEVLGAAKGKAARAGFDVRFDEAMSYGLPYPDGSYDRVLSSLFFHHLTRENKSKTLDEVHRVLKPGGEVHVADWGSPATPLMGLSSRLIQFLDGFETTADSFAGLLPALMASAGFTSVQETGAFNTIWGTIRLHKAFKT